MDMHVYDPTRNCLQMTSAISLVKQTPSTRQERVPEKSGEDPHREETARPTPTPISIMADLYLRRISPITPQSYLSLFFSTSIITSGKLSGEHD
ncbi:hypothetical protein EUGRSUZ_F00029 [Eucalyptus grandis]|uniref:Uncharacterized protein n=2 Tax=Eucalyptus grandis TaxID=71139 RepID=A0ACC3KAT3_EUCGR|nr:hypothetical protein EUGRSUZ_F00029 [Eucalyptus grandis]